MKTNNPANNQLQLVGKVCIITGGAGFLGRQHAAAICEAGGIPVIWDIDKESIDEALKQLEDQYRIKGLGMVADITNLESIQTAFSEVVDKTGRLDVLINNAANDPKVKGTEDTSWSRFENYKLEMWNFDLAVGLTGAFLCSQVVGIYMVKNGGGVIVNIASDLGVISPDQRLYKKEGLAEDMQPVKPITYSIIKHGLLGLTKYLATYWAENNIRVNAISPGGVYTDQPDEFVGKLNKLIPMGRMASAGEYKAALLFLCSEASSYMTGQNLIVDGGRTVW